MAKDDKRGKGNLVEEPTAKVPFTRISDSPDGQASDHPLHRTMSRVEKALGKFADQAANEERVLEDKEEWVRCVRTLAASVHGKLFLKVMCRHSQAFAPPTPENATKVVLNAARQEFYFKFVRPYLEPTQRGDLE